MRIHYILVRYIANSTFLLFPRHALNIAYFYVTYRRQLLRFIESELSWKYFSDLIPEFDLVQLKKARENRLISGV